MYTVYIVECADGTLYTGITTNLKRRVAEHNTSPKGAKYTRSRRPVCVVFTQRFQTRGKALRAEAALKKESRGDKVRRIAEHLVYS